MGNQAPVMPVRSEEHFKIPQNIMKKPEIKTMITSDMKRLKIHLGGKTSDKCRRPSSSRRHTSRNRLEIDSVDSIRESNIQLKLASIVSSLNCSPSLTPLRRDSNTLLASPPPYISSATKCFNTRPLVATTAYYLSEELPTQTAIISTTLEGI